MWQSGISEVQSVSQSVSHALFSSLLSGSVTGQRSPSKLNIKEFPFDEVKASDGSLNFFLGLYVIRNHLVFYLPKRKYFSLKLERQLINISSSRYCMVNEMHID